MNIYFAGSIRAGRQDQELYLRIVEKLRAYGTVLTEHVGDAKLSSYGEAHLTEQEICERDLTWLGSADVVIAEVTTPSLGVGYEVAKAEDLGKRILCLYRKQDGMKISAMLAGSTRLQLVAYKTLEDVSFIFEKFFGMSEEG